LGLAQRCHCLGPATQGIETGGHAQEREHLHFVRSCALSVGQHLTVNLQRTPGLAGVEQRLGQRIAHFVGLTE
jgi:hypothetical protein